jgi:hypothetical protein
MLREIRFSKAFRLQRIPSSQALNLSHSSALTRQDSPMLLRIPCAAKVEVRSPSVDRDVDDGRQRIFRAGVPGKKKEMSAGIDCSRE